MTGADGAGIRDWPAEVWARTEAALLLADGDTGAPLAGRPVLGEIFDDTDRTELRSLRTEGGPALRTLPE
ncbi:hypothetical protein GCM10010521_56670 [Streptomyces rameus]|uniref:Uncharacterized protein n=1 Tax=Streptomyces rameus TaxID=68261 RepID=A0ABN3UYI2_9ACTN